VRESRIKNIKNMLELLGNYDLEIVNLLTEIKNIDD
jgi:hypothetical protein